jgi:hypothetical protein
MRIRIALLIILAGLTALFAFASCGGHGRAQRALDTSANPAASGASNTFTLEQVSEGGKLTATLQAQGFFDLYQVAGEIGYDQSALELESVSQGAFLGAPPDVIFFQSGGEGRIPFAITRRMISAGSTGAGAIIEAKFRIKGTLPEKPVWVGEKLLANDSLRHKIEVKVEGGAK